jgi:hypothetical protein
MMGYSLYFLCIVVIYKEGLCSINEDMTLMMMVMMNIPTQKSIGMKLYMKLVIRPGFAQLQWCY